MTFDPTQFGATLATPVAGGFDPTKFGATPASPATVVNPSINQTQSPATFQATPTDSIVGGAAKLISNIPSSAVNSAESALKSINPVAIVKTIAKIPSEFSQLVQESGGVGSALKAGAKQLAPTAYGALVPKAAQQVISGDFAGARETLTNDPVGQILPFLLVGKAAAEKAGFGAQFDNTISKIASPVTETAGKIGSKILGGTGKVISQTLGAATGVGASSIEEAAKHSDAFTQALRGKTNPDDVVQTLQDAVQNIRDNRSTTYQDALTKIGEQKGSIDISPVAKTVATQLQNFGVRVDEEGNLDFSRSSIANNGSARADIQGVYNTLKDWGTQEGDRTPVGLDTLKKQLGDFYSDSGSARAFVQSVKSSLTGILNKNVEGYQDMTEGYSKASSLLDDIKSATGAGGKAKVDTVFTKLTTAMKADKELRLEILKQVQAEGAQPDLMAKIAGINMQSFIPKGLVGKGVDIGVLTHFFRPDMIPVLLSTSPRIIGEFVRALGIGAEKSGAILKAINKLPETTSLSEPSKALISAKKDTPIPSNVSVSRVNQVSK